nr:reverse transcriptase domain-containing protein [Tanacetum cinerariifolium]
MADNQPMWGNNQFVAPTPEAAIVVVDLGDNFTIKVHHLSMIKDRHFVRRARVDPHKHIAEFVEIYRMFRYGNTNADAIKLKLFPSSLAGDAKDLLRSCHRHGLGRETIIQIFYHGLDEATQAILDVKEIFIFKTPNEAHQLLEDQVLLKLDWSKDMKSKPIHKTVAFAESSKDSKLMEKMEALITKIDSQFKEIKGEMKEMRDRCNSCGGPHPSLDYDDKPIGGPKDEEANYSYGEKIEECYAKFIDLINEVRINVPFVDVLAGMPNYMKFLKDVVSNKNKMEQISTVFLNEEFFAIVQNKLPSKLEFMAIKIEEIPKQQEEVEDNFEELPLEENLRIKNSIQDPPTDLVMKRLPKHLECAFLEKESLLPVVISALLKNDEKKRLVSVLKKHKEVFAWKTSDIPGISPSFCKHKINFEDDVKPVV